MVLPGLQGDYSSQLERLRAVAVEAGETICGEQCLSMSIGLAIYPSDGATIETLIAEADRRMYKLKHQTKRQSEHNGEPSDDPETESGDPLRQLVQVLSDDPEAKAALEVSRYEA